MNTKDLIIMILVLIILMTTLRENNKLHTNKPTQKYRQDNTQNNYFRPPFNNLIGQLSD